MKKRKTVMLFLLALAAGLHAETWTLADCLDYALKNNIQIQKNRVSQQEGDVALWANRGQLFPSLSFASSQNVGYRPFAESVSVVQGDQVVKTSHNVTYQGTYGLNARVNIWDGGVTQKNIEAQKLQNEISALTTEQSELTIQEQITQLYVQILYSTEAKRVNEQLCETAKAQYERGQEMQRQGQMSKADVAQLEAQWRAAEYDIVSSETQVLNYKRQLKALLELDMSTPFDVASITPSDEQVLAPIPSSQSVLEQALENRPEIKSAELSMQAADLSVDIARRGHYPNLSASASLGSNHMSSGRNSWGDQMKTNLNMSAGVTVSVPILDNRRSKGNIEKAKLQKLNSALNLQDQKNTLSSTIENYWLQANSNQQQFKSARTRVQSQEVSYELLNEQFKNGLKNIVELRQGHDQLVQALQSELQSKYTTLLNMQLLKFYSGEDINL